MMRPLGLFIVASIGWLGCASTQTLRSQAPVCDAGQHKTIPDVRPDHKTTAFWLAKLTGNQADQLLADLSKHSVQGIHLIGEEDILDIIGLCLEHHQMKCLSKIMKHRIESEENFIKWLPDQFPKLKTSERFLVALLSDQEEVLEKL